MNSDSHSMNRVSFVSAGSHLIYEQYWTALSVAGTSASLVVMSEERLARLAGERQHLLPRPVLLPGVPALATFLTA